MKRLLCVLILGNLSTTFADGQSFSVHDLVTLSSLPSKNISRFMSKNGFVNNNFDKQADTIEASFIPKSKHSKIFTKPQLRIDLYHQNDSKCYLLHISSLAEFIDGQQSLIKSHFFYDSKKDISKDSSLIYQKANITIEAVKNLKDSVAQYTFKLTEKNVPDSIAYADELLQFDSHEYLVSYFGEKNVKKDFYYFSEKELKRCSVLFSGKPHQALFVWGDENNFNNLSYILVSNVLPTKEGVEHGLLDGNNEWKFKNGIRTGMTLREILRLNEMDFDIYGNKSDLAFMVKPEQKGKIDFRKTAIMFRCSNCYANEIFDQVDVSALDIAKADLPLRIFDIIIYPNNH
ncbi:MAG: hypothetical protein ABI416_08730 [Ginsengibacter sp.]